MDEAERRRYLAVRVQVGWGDCDPAGIVFYPRFYAWMDTVSHVLAREMGVPRESMIPPGRDMLGDALRDVLDPRLRGWQAKT